MDKLKGSLLKVKNTVVGLV